MRTWSVVVFQAALVVAVLAVSVVAAGQHSRLRGTAAGVGGGAGVRPSFPSGVNLAERGARGQRAVDLLGSRLGDVAAAYGKTAAQLSALLRGDNSLRLDQHGRLYVEEPSVSDSTSSGMPARRELDVVDGSLVPDAQTFTLHSRPGSRRTIYLDFDGATLTGTGWNIEASKTFITAPAFDTDGNVGSFSSGELREIQMIWQSVAEDFAPFDVDVTTEAPPASAIIRTNTDDMVFGMTALITVSDGVYSCNCGGIAHIGVFDIVENGPSFKPALVFYNHLSDFKSVAEAISHELGHTVGLHHDGTSSTGYYLGQGEGPRSWAPIMGAGYYSNIVQWSKGEYANANNKEDDLSVMQSYGLPLRVDDHGNTTATATALVAGTTAGSLTSYTARGIIHAAGDVDVFSVTSSAGAMTVTVSPASLSPNLDPVVSVVDGSGRVLGTNAASSTQSLTASLTIPVTAAGKLFIKVQSGGSGDPATTGYSRYGSLGNFQLTVSVPAAVPVAGWRLSEASDGSLVFQDTVTRGDHRVVLSEGVTADWGTPDVISAPGVTLAVFPGWTVAEESSALVFRATGAAGGLFLFFPNSYVDFGCPVPAAGASGRSGVNVLYRGVRWVIQEENGVLVFRDMLSATDSRYAFFPGCGVVRPGVAGWQLFQEADGTLAFRDVVTPGNHRIVMHPGVTKALGSPVAAGGETLALAAFPGWAVNEESGMLVFRATSGTGGRYTFYPGSHVDVGCSNPVSGGSANRSGMHVLYRGVRWLILEESGMLVFRDMLSATDSRYAFATGCGVLDV